MRFQVGKKPRWRPVASVAAVTDLINEVALRMLMGDMGEERMQQFAPMFKEAQRVRGLVPIQREIIEGLALTLASTDPKELKGLRDDAVRLLRESQELSP